MNECGTVLSRLDKGHLYESHTVVQQFLIIIIQWTRSAAQL